MSVDSTNGKARGLHGHVVNELGLAIARGDLAVGDQIVPEQLGERYGVSRTVVREVLRVLESKGMVAARPRTGTRVQPVEQWHLLDRQVILWRIMGPGRDSQLRDLLQLRLAVEPAAAHSASAAATDADIDVLRQACDAMAQAIEIGNLAAFTRADITFHSTLLKASGNRVFAQLIDSVDAVLHARTELHLMPTSVENAAVRAHRQIVDAIAAGDGRGAENAARQIIEVASEEIFSTLPG